MGDDVMSIEHWKANKVEGHTDSVEIKLGPGLGTILIKANGLDLSVSVFTAGDLFSGGSFRAGAWLGGDGAFGGYGNSFAHLCKALHFCTWAVGRVGMTPEGAMTVMDSVFVLHEDPAEAAKIWTAIGDAALSVLPKETT